MKPYCKVLLILFVFREKINIIELEGTRGTFNMHQTAREGTCGPSDSD